MTSVAETDMSSPRSRGLRGRGEFLKSSAGGDRAGDPVTMGVMFPGVPLKRGIVVPAAGLPYCCLRWRTMGASVESSSSISRNERTGLPIFTGFEGVEDIAGGKVEYKDTGLSPNCLGPLGMATPNSPGTHGMQW